MSIVNLNVIMLNALHGGIFNALFFVERKGKACKKTMKVCSVYGDDLIDESNVYNWFTWLRCGNFHVKNK